MKVMVGGVSQLYQGDLDLGRYAAERLQNRHDLGPDVLVEDLHYGAVAVAQRLEEVAPDLLVLVAAVRRDRPPASVARRRVALPARELGQVQGAVADAVTGYVDIDLVVEVAAALGALPARTVAIEVEPVRTEPSERLSPAALTALDEALALALAEVRRAPLLALAECLRPLTDGPRLEPCAALDAVRAVLGELRHLDRDGRWGRTFAERDRLRTCIAEGLTGEGMDGRDWVLWWTLIEELDRLQAQEALHGH